MRAVHFIQLAVLVAVCMATGCSSLKVSQDYDPGIDFSDYRTFDLYPEAQPKTGDIRVDSPLLDARIRKAVNKTLQEMNYLRVSAQTPDFFVAYHLEIRTRLESSTYQTGVGVHTYRYPYWGGLGYETAVRQYDEGMLVIDILDADNNQLVWRGVGTRRFPEHQNPAKLTAAIKQTVSKILAQFPPQPTK